eukprot:TRINITY_DN1585_c0_g1_i3.p1 TRINITY_DN1585_c0_g1~~TRINITY_DN1585_c0_g1_i3.p1  ORF type:complete len:265 (-),score=40.23 TRINITY_DN1585_c0_g1_i3:45-839(-)
MNICIPLPRDSPMLDSVLSSQTFTLVKWALTENQQVRERGGIILDFVNLLCESVCTLFFIFISPFPTPWEGWGCFISVSTLIHLTSLFFLHLPLSNFHPSLPPSLSPTSHITTTGHLMSELSWTTSGEIVQCIVDYFRKENSSIKIGITGWCMGGALSLYCAATLKDQLQAAVPFYGIPPEDEVDLTDITCPLLGHWAKVDDWCSPEKVSELDEKLTKGNVAHTFYTYDAQHAFSNSTREEVYDAKCAQQAYDRTFVFFGENLI